MAFFIGVPVCILGMPVSDTAGDDDNPSPFLDPSDELIAVISFIREDQPVSQIIRLQQHLCHADAPLRSCCPASAWSRASGPVQSAHGRPVPIHPPMSMYGNDYTQSAMIHSVPAGHARRYL